MALLYADLEVTMKKFLSKLSNDKIKINWNKNPIKMDDFLSFLTVETRRGTGHLGYDNGWTRHYGDNDLEIRGGVVKGVEYLDTLQYRKKLDNPFNNYVNPFYLFEILNDDGKKFFLEYYSDEIQKELDNASNSLKRAQTYKDELSEFWAGQGI